MYVHTYIWDNIFQTFFCCLIPLYFPLTDPAVSAAVWYLRKCGLASWYPLVPVPSFGCWSGPLWVDRAQYCYCSSDMIAFTSLRLFQSFIRLLVLRLLSAVEDLLCQRAVLEKCCH